MEIECSKFLPADMSNIILKMIYIKRNTFENAAQRNNDDYTSWPTPRNVCSLLGPPVHYITFHMDGR